MGATQLWVVCFTDFSGHTTLSSAIVSQHLLIFLLKVSAVGAKKKIEDTHLRNTPLLHFFSFWFWKLFMRRTLKHHRPIGKESLSAASVQVEARNTTLLTS